MNKDIVDVLSTPEGVDEHVEKITNYAAKLIMLCMEIGASDNYYIRNYNTLVKALRVKLGEKEANIIIEAAKLTSFAEFKKEVEKDG